MKLYHATPEKYSNDIGKYGLRPNESIKKSNDTRLNIEAVYGFIDQDSAINFAIDNCWESFTVFCFDTGENEVIEDTEYDGESIAVLTEENIPVSAISVKYDHGMKVKE
jgi:hypothetical protein